MKRIYVVMRVLILLLLTDEFVGISAKENPKKSLDRDENGEIDKSKENESLVIAMKNETNNGTTRICVRRQNSQMHEIAPAAPKQFPFVAAIMSQQHKYLCSGAVVSNGLVLTSAQCVQQSPSYVLLNTTTVKKDDDTVVMLYVTNSEKFPTYTGEDSPVNVGLIYTEKCNKSVASKITISNYTRHQTIVDLEAIGFGLNANVDQVKELQYVGLEQRSPFTQQDMIVAYLDCVDTKVLTCFKDLGGPAIFDKELIGIVVKGQGECNTEMSGIFATNKRMVDILPTYTFKAWLDEKIKKNEEREQIPLETYLPVLREKKIHRMTSSMVEKILPNCYIIVMLSIITKLVIYS